MGYPRAGIRWREDTGWELRCPDCMASRHGTTYWPLTDEFWDKRNMKRCRACHRTQNRKWERAQYEKRGSRYHKRRAYVAQYRKDARRAKQVYMDAYYWQDPEKQRAKARAHYAANRDDILARRRARLHAAKAA